MPVYRAQPVVRPTARLLAPLLLVVAGCAGVSKYVPSPVNAIFSVLPSARTVNTNGEIQLKAVNAAGGAAAVNWRVVRGENDAAIGQGTIDAHGVYTPPSSLSRDLVSVEIEAQLRNDPTKTATEVLEVTPGFLQPLTPENSALPAGGSVEVTAQLAEVGGGTVAWEIARAPGGKQLGAEYGSFSQESCEHSRRNYTICSAVYTAPPALPASARDLYVVASMSSTGTGTVTRQPLHILLSDAGVSSTPLTNQAIQNSLVQLGSSGGNNNDADISEDGAGRSLINDCCGGTLGALVRDETGTQYILSNNHVLAESDQGKPGDSIVQPGLIDSNCDQNAGRPVASLRYVVPLSASRSNVDAALAEVNAGTVDPSGAILQLGGTGTGTNGGFGAAAPAGGQGEAITAASFSAETAPLLVAKSGRTTGLTCSTLDAIDLSIEVDYYKDCAETQPYYRKTFANQLGIGGDGFADSGDSGALVVNAGSAEPLGLFFAGGTDDHGGGFSVAAPIQDVLAELGSEAGREFSIVGGAEHPVSCLNYDAKPAAAAAVASAQRKRAESAARRNANSLINPATGVLDVAAGASADTPGDPAVLIYVDKAYIDKAKGGVAVPQTVGGIRTMVIPTDQASLDAGGVGKPPAGRAGIHLPEDVLQAAATVQQAYAKRLMADPAIFGVGVTESRDNPSEAALLILVDMARTPRSMPVLVGGLRTRYVRLHRFHVTKSKFAGAPHRSSCALKSLASRSSSFDPQSLPPLALPPR